MDSLRTLIDQHGARFLRYAGVSLVGVTLGQLLLFLCNSVLGWGAVVSNAIAVTLSTIPPYLLNRQWVWGKTGDHSFAREILPFWGFAFAGLVISTVAVWWVEKRSSSTAAIQLTNLASFGVLWVAKYFVLDKLLFGEHTHHAPEHQPA